MSALQPNASHLVSCVQIFTHTRYSVDCPQFHTHGSQAPTWTELKDKMDINPLFFAFATIPIQSGSGTCKYAACFIHFSLVFSKLELRSFHTAFLCSSFFAGRTRAFCVPLFSLHTLGPFVFLYFSCTHSGLSCSSIFPGPTRAFCVPLFPLDPLGRSKAESVTALASCSSCCDR